MIALKGDLRDAVRDADKVRSEFAPGPLQPSFTEYLAFKLNLAAADVTVLPRRTEA